MGAKITTPEILLNTKTSFGGPITIPEISLNKKLVRWRPDQHTGDLVEHKAVHLEAWWAYRRSGCTQGCLFGGLITIPEILLNTKIVRLKTWSAYRRSGWTQRMFVWRPDHHTGDLVEHKDFSFGDLISIPEIWLNTKTVRLETSLNIKVVRLEAWLLKMWHFLKRVRLWGYTNILHNLQTLANIFFSPYWSTCFVHITEQLVAHYWGYKARTVTTKSRNEIEFLSVITSLLLVSTRPLAEKSTENLPGDKGYPVA
jgi:hypothetical protein